MGVVVVEEEDLSVTSQILLRGFHLWNWFATGAVRDSV